VRYQAALAYAVIGRRAEALAELAKAVELRYPVETIRQSPELDPLRGEAEYKRIITR
jgi:hypothetical protein